MHRVRLVAGGRRAVVHPLDDGLAVVTALYEGAFPLPDPGDCAGAPGLAPPASADLRLTVAAVAGGAVSVVVLDLLEPVTLPAEASLLRLGLAKGEGCVCTVRTSDALAWLGGPIPTVAVSGGAAWPLATEATVDLCGG